MAVNGQDETNKLINNSFEEVVDLRQYFIVLNKYKWQVGSLASAFALLAALISLNLTPIFKATATLLIEADQTKAVSFEEIVGLNSNRKEYYLTQFEILKSGQIAQKVIEKLNLQDYQDFNTKKSWVVVLKNSLPLIPQKNNNSQTDAERENSVLLTLKETFSNRLTISPVRNTQLVNISFESSDATLAALIANTLGDVYIEQHQLAKMAVNQKATDWLTSRILDLRIRLDNSESKLQRYLENENLTDVQGVLGLASQELEQISLQLVEARNEKNKYGSIIQEINDSGRDNIEMLKSISEITSQQVVQDLIKTLTNIELKRSVLAQTYGPKHPNMIAAQTELNMVTQNISIQIRRLVIGMEKKLNTNTRNVTALENELERMKTQYQTLTAKENEYHQLSREVETNRNIYDTFFTRLKETEVTSDFNSAVARFTDKAFRPNKPAKPNKELIVILTFTITLGLGLIIAFVVEALSDTLKSASDIENKLSQRVLSLLPLVNHKKNTGLLLHFFFDETGKKFAESIRTLRTSLNLTQLNKDTKIIEVTSSIPSEGKTTIATNLAFSLGQLEKTLLIDADMRKPSIGKHFDIPPYHSGLANLIAGTHKAEECIYFDEISGISVMPVGQLPNNPLELLASKEFGIILNELKQSFQRIVLDTAPVQAVSDALVIAPLTDTVVYVVKSDDTRIGVVQNALGRLVEANAKIAGVVLNQVDSTKLTHADYYNGYYSEYSYGENESKPT